ncbi:lipoprotein [Herbaspirillum lusitanum]|uniref:Lipoprotein n=1 Tax=Herbaspirillum lusitanum TaxID=213312 RepID=A0ABW9ABR0_9BURK
MKSSISQFHRAGFVSATGAALLVLLLAGCGQKGPLYMPKIPPARTTSHEVAPNPDAATDAAKKGDMGNAQPMACQAAPANGSASLACNAQTPGK